MDRTELMREYLTPFMAEHINKKIEEAVRMRKNSFLPSVQALLYDALERQEKQPQWKPSYLGLFHLNTSLITERYEYEFILADKQMYLDEFQVIRYWHPDFLYQDEQEYVRKELGKRFIRLNGYEVSYAKHFILHEYRNIIGVYWKDHLEDVVNLEEFKKVEKTGSFRFLFGDYMGETHTVLNYKEVL